MENVKKLEGLYEGKAKKIYKTNDPDLLWVEYKDDATAFDGLKKGTISNKGVLNNSISVHFFELLSQKGIQNHFVRKVSDREQIVKKIDIIPIEVIVRNIAAGSISKRLGIKEGVEFDAPIVEYCYKSDDLSDPMINDDHIRALKLADDEQVRQIRRAALEVNEILKEYLKSKGIILVDFKLEFGMHKGEILLGDEISPDTCRFWDKKTKQKLDKDRFRHDLGKVKEAYEEVYNRLIGN